jgi:hypothetical protein
MISKGSSPSLALPPNFRGPNLRNTQQILSLAFFRSVWEFILVTTPQ